MAVYHYSHLWLQFSPCLCSCQYQLRIRLGYGMQGGWSVSHFSFHLYTVLYFIKQAYLAQFCFCLSVLLICIYEVWGNLGVCSLLKLFSGNLLFLNNCWLFNTVFGVKCFNNGIKGIDATTEICFVSGAHTGKLCPFRCLGSLSYSAVYKRNLLQRFILSF